MKINNDYINGIVTSVFGLGLGIYGFYENDCSYYFGTLLFSIASISAFYDGVNLSKLEEILK